MTMTKKIKHMARQAKRAGWDRERARKAAPPESHPLHQVFMDEFDRFQPRQKSA